MATLTSEAGIEADEHLHRCRVYIDLNMVRAGVVNHPYDGSMAAIVRFRIRPSGMRCLIYRS